MLILEPAKIRNAILRCCVTTVLLFPVGLLAQTEGPLVQAQNLQQLTPRVYAIPDNFVSLVPNVGIIVGDSATLVVDTGLGPRNGETIKAVLDGISDNETLYIVTTHYHPEHSLGTAGLGDDATLVLSQVQRQEMANGEGIKNFFAGISPLHAELLNGIEYPAADILFDGEIVLNLGGLTARVFEVGPLHTLGDTLVFIEEERILFSGDVVMEGVFPSPDGANSSIARWLDTLDRLEALDPVTIVGAHGAIGDISMLENWRQLFTALRAEVTELKRQGVSQAEAASRLTTEFSSKYPQWRADARRMNGAVQVLYRELP